jgi:hypothetical protein
VHHSITDFTLDIAQNSIEAGAGVVTVDILEQDSMLSICIGDNGKGMSAEVLAKVQDPFYTDGVKHSARSVGLGIPFLDQAAKAAGGEFEIKSEEGLGTSVFFSFNTAHLDCPPLGDIPGTILSMMLFDGEYECMVTRSNSRGSYRVSRNELSDALGGIHDAGALKLAKEYISSLDEELL